LGLKKEKTEERVRKGGRKTNLGKQSPEVSLDGRGGRIQEKTKA